MGAILCSLEGVKKYNFSKTHIFFDATKAASVEDWKIKIDILACVKFFIFVEFYYIRGDSNGNVHRLAKFSLQYEDNFERTSTFSD